jgi:hypothetical protein
MGNYWLDIVELDGIVETIWNDFLGRGFVDYSEFSAALSQHCVQHRYPPRSMQRISVRHEYSPDGLVYLADLEII